MAPKRTNEPLSGEGIMRRGLTVNTPINLADETADPEPQKRGSRQDEAMMKAPDDIRSLYDDVRRFFGYKRAEGYIPKNLTQYVHAYRAHLLQFLLRVDEECYKEPRKLPSETLAAMRAVAQQVRDCLLVDAVVVAEATYKKAARASDRMAPTEAPSVGTEADGEYTAE